jgi:hypothetical protein
MTAARRLGHANASITTSHYARPIDQRDAQVAMRLDKLGTERASGRATGTEAPEEGLLIDDQGSDLARPAGFEPATDGLEVRCSIR